MTNPLALTVVGCGAVTEMFHLPSQAKVSDLRLVGLADRNLERAQFLAAKFGGVAAADYHALTVAADCVVVATPHSTHRDIVADCLDAGKHVLCEKPLATTVAECDEMIAHASRSSGRLYIGLFRRMFPAYRWLKHLLDTSHLGRPQSFLFEEGGPYNWPTASGFFWNREQAGGGVLADTGAHTLDLVCWWLGEWESVEYWDDNLGNMDANCRIELTMKSGVTGRVELSRTHNLPNRFRIECEYGWFEASAAPPWPVVLFDKRTGWTQRVEARNKEAPLPWTIQNYSFLDAFAEQWRHFAKAVRGEPNGLATPHDAREVAHLMEACYANRQPLPMPWMGAAQNGRAL
jgi:predicted dehydrogenase